MSRCKVWEGAAKRRRDSQKMLLSLFHWRKPYSQLSNTTGCNPKSSSFSRCATERKPSALTLGGRSIAQGWLSRIGPRGVSEWMMFKSVTWFRLPLWCVDNFTYLLKNCWETPHAKKALENRIKSSAWYQMQKAKKGNTGEREINYADRITCKVYGGHSCCS